MIFRIAIRNLLHKPLYTALCWLLLACSTSVLLVLWALNRQARQQLEQQIDGIDLVLGAKGSPLQLILSSVYHLDNPTGNIPLSEASRFMQHPLVESAVPISLGDSYHGFRIIGTTTAYLDKYNAKPAEGKVFSKSMEVVAGVEAARKAGLKVGSRFAGTHGLGKTGHVHEGEEYIVTGILPATGLAIDQLLLTPLQSVWDIHAPHHDPDDHDHGHAEGENHDHDHDHEDAKGHDHDKADGHDHDHAEGEAHDHADAKGHDHDEAKGHDHDHAEEAAEKADPAHDPQQQVTAVLIKFRSPMGQLQFPRMINEYTNMQAAVPAIEINRLQALLGTGAKVLRALGWLLAGLAACSIFVTLVQGTHERRYELALIRTMGGSRGKLLALVFAEAFLLGVLGVVTGIALSRVALLFLQQELFAGYHLNFSGAMPLTAADGITAAAIVGACMLAALLPAVRAFRLNIAKTLANA
ncbi:FtsX-like permease family protein [Chitinophaga sp.]|uniref:ABC transporter permease n=1 Tax=Chitinophaga sp. TaxID=1869181 RepID=UPI00261C8134|nr:FtsX-like permease family protein [uncultured Chitinophaga sp.]